MTTMEDGAGGGPLARQSRRGCNGRRVGCAPRVAASMWLCAVGVPLDADSANA